MDTPPPEPRGIPRWVYIFLVLLVLGTLASAAVYLTRIQPVMAELSILRTEATEFRAMSLAQVGERVEGQVSWEDLLKGEVRGRYARLRGRTGQSYQMMKGMYGGTLFLYPPDAPSYDTGPRVLLYFEEEVPPNPGSLVEAMVWISRIDPGKSVGTISPEQQASLQESTPAAIVIAKPLRILEAGPAPEEAP